MPDLVIRIKKKSDGSAALSCIRADGSTTWQQQDGELGRFFPLHDLTHYAVESVLELRRAFFGLVAEGWDLTDFGRSGTKGRIPEEAGLAEVIVGFFDLERATCVLGTAEDFAWKITSYYADKGLPPMSFRLSQAQIDEVRRLRGELFAQWESLPPGDALELSFDRSAESAA